VPRAPNGSFICISLAETHKQAGMIGASRATLAGYAGPGRTWPTAVMPARFVRGERTLNSQDSGLHAFSGFADELVHHVVEVAGLPECGKLTVCAGAFVEDAVGVGDFLAAAQLVQHVIQEPLD
jgi:hypothetical protein